MKSGKMPFRSNRKVVMENNDNTCRTVRKSTLEVQRQVNKERKPLKEMEMREIKFTGHTIRHIALSPISLTVKCYARKGEEDMHKRMGRENYSKMKRMAEDRRELFYRQNITFKQYLLNEQQGCT